MSIRLFQQKNMKQNMNTILRVQRTVPISIFIFEMPGKKENFHKFH